MFSLFRVNLDKIVARRQAQFCIIFYYNTHFNTNVIDRLNAWRYKCVCVEAQCREDRVSVANVYHCKSLENERDNASEMTY